MRTRHDSEITSYHPVSDQLDGENDNPRPGPGFWADLDIVTKRIIGIASAAAVIILICGWILQKTGDGEKITQVERQLYAMDTVFNKKFDVLNEKIDAVHEDATASRMAVCFLARKSGQPIAPKGC